MTTPANPRTSPALRRYAMSNRAAAQPVMERLLRFIGADISFADDVIGDLAEERMRRGERDGMWSARWWYIREAFRSAPHLAWNAVQHGGPLGRARVATIVAAVALLVTAAAVKLRSADLVPTRLEVDGQRITNASDGVIVNTRHPVVLAMRVFDARGRTLKSSGVHYRWMSGAPVSVSKNGIVTCSYAGDALLRASLGAVATTVRIKCLPVKEVLAHTWTQLVAGDSSQEFSFVALDPDGQPVYRLAGTLRVDDSTIATLKNGRIYPLSPGHTRAVMQFGDGQAQTEISVYKRVATFVGLRNDQRFVIAPLRLAIGDTIRWPLPQGLFWLQYHPASNDDQRPTFAVDGPVMCIPAFGPYVDRVQCLVRGSGATVRIAHSGAPPSATVNDACEACRSPDVIAQRKLTGNRTFAAPYVEGALSIEHQKYP